MPSVTPLSTGRSSIFGSSSNSRWVVFRALSLDDSGRARVLSWRRREKCHRPTTERMQLPSKLWIWCRGALSVWTKRNLILSSVRPVLLRFLVRVDNCFFLSNGVREDDSVQFAIYPQSGSEAAGREDQVLQRRGESEVRARRLVYYSLPASFCK